jgi:glutaminyl-peptide cyclotransferase
MARFVRLVPLLVLLLVTLSAFAPTLAQSDNPLYAPVKLLEPQVLSVRPHDTTAYTQGLLLYNGYLYESTGRHGASTLRKVDPQTGEVLQMIRVPDEYFAEGLALVDDRLIQLTWQSGVAFIYDRETFEQIGTYTYEGEGWGLCTDGRYLYMSDGSPFLDVRDPQTFELIFSGLVTVQGSLVERLNELECVGDYVYANIWQTDYIVQINKYNGVVVAVIDASNLLTEEEKAQFDEQEVLNGIAYLPETDTFLITGKHWPKMYEVRFVEKQSGTSQ